MLPIETTPLHRPSDRGIEGAVARLGDLEGEGQQLAQQGAGGDGFSNTSADLPEFAAFVEPAAHLFDVREPLQRAFQRVGGIPRGDIDGHDGAHHRTGAPCHLALASA